MFADLLPFVDALENIDRIYPFPLDGRASIETSARMQILINCRLNCSSDIGFVDFSASSMIPYPLPPLHPSVSSYRKAISHFLTPGLDTPRPCCSVKNYSFHLSLPPSLPLPSIPLSRSLLRIEQAARRVESGGAGNGH